MELGDIEREVFIEASPDVVYEVVSRPEHVERWWPDEARYDPVPGGTGAIVFGQRDEGGTVVAFTVVEADPPRTFSFRWTHPAEEQAAVGNSFLVTFELVPTAGGTLLKLTETGFRERGWDAAVAEAEHRDHVTGWDFYLPRLEAYVAALGARR